jgi:hypothetical protein
MIVQTEPQRKEFLITMFELGHLHVSMLKLDEIIIASNAGFKSPDMIHLQGINSHSPFFSKYSPGILHFLLLGIHLDELGVRYFDLTPGGKDGYKSMLSNTTEIAHELWIADKKYIFFKIAEEKVKNWLKEASGIPLFQNNNFIDLSLSLKNLYNRIKLRINLEYIFQGTENLNYLEGKNRNKYFKLPNDRDGNPKNQVFFSVSKNIIADLFLFRENHNPSTRRDFLSDCLK